MSITIKLRRGNAANWSSQNIVLASGEPGYEIDTGRFKIGNGSTPWNDLSYAAIVPSGFVAGSGINLTLGSNSGSLTIDTDLTALTGVLNELVDDRIGSGLFVAGTGINLLYNDGGNSFTVSVTGLINNPNNNRILTSRDSSTTGIDAEANLIFDGNNLVVSGGGLTSPTGNFTTSICSALLDIDSIRIDGTTISSTSTNGNIYLDPDGTGTVVLETDLVTVGQYDTMATIGTNGEGGLKLCTNFGNDTGDILISAGIDAPIGISPNGTGSVNINSTNIRVGVPSLDPTTIIQNASGNLLFQTAYGAGTSILLEDNPSGNIKFSGIAALFNNVPISVSGHTHLASDITDFNEAVDDRIGTGLFVAGTGIDLNYDDSGDSFTISVTGLINDPADNRILTSRDSTTTGIDAENNFTFDGSTVSIGNTGLASSSYIKIYSSETTINDDANIQFIDTSGNTRLRLYSSPTNGDDDCGIISARPFYINSSNDVNITSNYGIIDLYGNGLFYNTIPISVSGHTHLASDITDFNEAVDDRIGGGLFVSGTGIDLNYNDGTNNFTVSVTGLINNPANNRILTSRDNTTTGIDAESNLTFDGSNLVIINGGLTSVTGNFTTSISGALLNIDNIQIDGNTITSTNTNGNLIIQTTGDGSLQRDGGGNSRGDHAVDLQNTRSSGTMVAAGSYSVIGGGLNNTALSSYTSVLGGINNIASQTFSVVAGGSSNKALGLASAIIGGGGNTASGQLSVVCGGYSNIASGSASAILGGQNNNDAAFSNVFILGSNITATQNDTTYVENLKIKTAGGLSYTPSFVSPSAIGSDQNDYNPTGGDVLRLEASGADRNITGLVLNSRYVIVIINIGSTYNIILKHENTNSTAANRFITPTGGDHLILPDGSTTLLYDSTSSRWRVL